MLSFIKKFFDKNPMRGISSAPRDGGKVILILESNGDEVIVTWDGRFWREDDRPEIIIDSDDIRGWKEFGAGMRN